MNRSLGQILVNQNLITDEQVNEALDYKENNRTRFGEACVKLGFIDKNQLINVLSVQLHIPQVNLNHFEIDGEMIDLLDKDTANDYNVLPLYAIDNELACKAMEEFNKKSYYIDLDFDCETVSGETILMDIYGKVTEPDICP